MGTRGTFSCKWRLRRPPLEGEGRGTTVIREGFAHPISMGRRVPAKKVVVLVDQMGLQER
jgi:hypothetical protein